MEIVDRFETGQLPTIAAIDLRRVRLPLRQPFIAAHGAEHEREVILVRVMLSSGMTGWGECPTLSRPGYTSESTDLAWQALCKVLAPDWLAGRVGPIGDHPMAHSALETATLDAAVRDVGWSLVAEVGATRRPVPACAVLGLAASVEALLDEAATRVAAGYRHLKLKIEPGRDVHCAAAVSSAFPGVTLSADANGSYPSADAVPAGLGELGLRYIEQPVQPKDLAGSGEVMARLATPVALDESIMTIADLRAAVDRSALGVVNVKPARLGGVVEALQVMRIANELGIDAFVGGMLETGVGRAAALAVASHPACTLPTDVGPSSRYFVDDIAAPIELDDGCMQAPDGVGIGIEPDPGRLDRFTVDLWSSGS